MIVGEKPSNKSSSKTRKSKSTNYGNFEDFERGGNLERFPRSVIKFHNVNSAHGIVHPTQKPVALFEYLIKTYTNEGETVLDNCSGSGTTAVAAINTGRRFICIEKDLGYYLASCGRVFGA
jgi:site-specific DNA-methyltransferase (adenine-specific)